MGRSLSWMILAGSLSTVIASISIHFSEDTVSVSTKECLYTTLHCEGNISYPTISLEPDYKDVVTVFPSVVSLRCPGSADVKICAGEAVGHTIINAVPDSMTIKDSLPAFLHVNVNRVRVLEALSVIVGWMYFLAWSISFYPQLYINYVRKSVVGLNFDFVALNIIGFVLYSLFNCGMYYIPSIQQEYLDLHPRGLIPVLFNDVFFSVHAAVLVGVTIFQCCIYERGTQRVSRVAKGIICLYGGILLTTAVLASMGIITWCNFLYGCSYIKLSITLIKYIPQAYLNYTRKSTEGWSIANIFLDFTGGALSVLQMIINGYNYNDWESIFGDFTKFGLGVFSIMFDIFFMYQHYVLYKDRTFDLKGI